MMRNLRSCFVLIYVLLLAIGVLAQWAEPPMTGSPQQMLPDRTKLSGMSGLAPELEAGLVEAHRNASEKKAVVRAEVWGVDINNPPSSGQAKEDAAYLSYVLDRNQPVSTAEREYTFQNLSRGEHTVIVRLMSADKHQIGADVTLKVKIPK